MLTQGNFSAEMSLAKQVIFDNPNVNKSNYKSISYLPLAHMFERAMLGCCI